MHVLPFAQTLTSELDAGTKLTTVWGGVGSGKSYAIAQLILYACLTRAGYDKVSGQTKPLQVLVTMRTQGDLTSILLPRCKEVFGPLATFKADSEHRRWEFINGAVVTFKDYKMYSTQDESQNSLEGRDYHLLISDETQHLSKEFYGHSFARCRLPMVSLIDGSIYPSQLFWLGRPSYNDGYLRDALEKREDGMKVTILFPRTKDNPFTTEDYLQSLRVNNTLDDYNALTQAEPGSMMGAKASIYSLFSQQDFPEGNLVGIPEVDYNHPTYVAMDFNVDQPSVLFIQELMVNGRKRSVIVDEWCPDAEVLATDIVDFINSCNYYDAIEEIICDPAGGARNVAAVDGPIVQILKRSQEKGGTGKRIYAKHPEGDKRLVESGISRVQARIYNADNERDLLVRKELWDKPQFRRGIKHTILGYRRDSETRVILDGKKGDQTDHIADALRYYVIRRCWNGLNKVVAPAPTFQTSMINPNMSRRLPSVIGEMNEARFR